MDTATIHQEGYCELLVAHRRRSAVKPFSKSGDLSAKCGEPASDHSTELTASNSRQAGDAFSPTQQELLLVEAGNKKL